MGGITNEVLAERIDGVSHLIDERFKTANDANELGHQNLEKNSNTILEQVKKTNGRVDKIEIWRNQLMGAWKLAIFLGATNIIVIVIFIYKVIIK